MPDIRLGACPLIGRRAADGLANITAACADPLGGAEAELGAFAPPEEKGEEALGKADEIVLAVEKFRVSELASMADGQERREAH